MEEKGEGRVKNSQKMGDIIYRWPQTKKNEMSKNPLSYLYLICIGIQLVLWVFK